MASTGAARAVAKDTLDWAVYTQQGVQLSTHTSNTLTGIRTAFAQFKSRPGWNPKQAVFCMEHTGIYNAHLLDLLDQQKLAIWLESSLQIKQAGGMQRGKTDKIDAQRIAQYARSGGPVSFPRSNVPLAAATRDYAETGFSDRAAGAVPPVSGSIKRHGPPRYNLLAVPVAEQETFISKSLQKTAPADRLKGNVKKSLTALQEEQKVVEQQIKDLIQTDARLKELFDLIVSVPGIGPVIATELLVATNEMQTISDPKKLACHAGVAPFDRAAGAVPFGHEYPW
ncbi:transposase [Spirosoma sp. BT702]|uniref:Transposase n=1 Tax=Spirosoma profusum TaxID=2771354 RepID=A0A926XY84_9BACT|nr:transposase [Spirosoma profusum]MBD2702301.1 transposase [Spirosoma profusum]